MKFLPYIDMDMPPDRSNNSQSMAKIEKYQIRVIDHTASETSVLRVIHVIKYLRAFLFHFLLSAFSISLYFLTGISGIYLPINDLIDALGSLSEVLHQQGDPYGAFTLPLVVMLLI